MSRKTEIVREYQQLIHKIEYKYDWVIEICLTKYDKQIEFWISRKDIGIKKLVDRIENTEQSFESLMYMLEANIKNYIAAYRTEFVR